MLASERTAANAPTATVESLVVLSVMRPPECDGDTFEGPCEGCLPAW